MVFFINVNFVCKFAFKTTRDIVKIPYSFKIKGTGE